MRFVVCIVSLLAGCGARTALSTDEDDGGVVVRPDARVMRIDAGPPTIPTVRARMGLRCDGHATWVGVVSDQAIDCSTVVPYGEGWYELIFPAELVVSEEPQSYAADGLGRASVVFLRCRRSTGPVEDCVRAVTGRVTVARFAPGDEALVNWTVRLADGRADETRARITQFCTTSCR